MVAGTELEDRTKPRHSQDSAQGVSQAPPEQHLHLYGRQWHRQPHRGCGRIAPDPMHKDGTHGEQ